MRCGHDILDLKPTVSYRECRYVVYNPYLLPVSEDCFIELD
jgi:hypothetical protein